jgi:hypothetical protein
MKQKREKKGNVRMRNGKEERKIYAEGIFLPERNRKKKIEKVAIQQQKKNQSTRKRNTERTLRRCWLRCKEQRRLSVICPRPD